MSDSQWARCNAVQNSHKVLCHLRRELERLLLRWRSFCGRVPPADASPAAVAASDSPCPASAEAGAFSAVAASVGAGALVSAAAMCSEPWPHGAGSSTSPGLLDPNRAHDPPACLPSCGTDRSACGASSGTGTAAAAWVAILASCAGGTAVAEGDSASTAAAPAALVRALTAEAATGEQP